MGYKGISVWGTRVLVFGVRGYWCLGYEGISVSVWGTRVLVSGVRGYWCPGYEGISVRGTRVLEPGYEGINVRGTRVLERYEGIRAGVRGY